MTAAGSFWPLGRSRQRDRAGRSTRSSRAVRLLLGALGIGIAGTAWQLAATQRLVDPTYLPPPSTVLLRLPALFTGGPLAHDVLTSVGSVALGMLIANVLGLLLAILCYRIRYLRMLVSPVVELVRGVAPLALLPAFLLLFGLGWSSAVAIIVWCAWVPIYLNSLAGLDAVNRAFVQSARAVSAGPMKIATSVYVPACAEAYLTGLRIAFGASWLAVVAAEMLGSNSGLGFRILEWSQTFHIVDMYGAITVIGLIGLSINAAVTLVHRRVMRWREP